MAELDPWIKFHRLASTEFEIRGLVDNSPPMHADFLALRVDGKFLFRGR